jgi:hypothetical protein
MRNYKLKISFGDRVTFTMPYIIGCMEYILPSKQPDSWKMRMTNSGGLSTHPSSMIYKNNQEKEAPGA